MSATSGKSPHPPGENHQAKAGKHPAGQASGKDNQASVQGVQDDQAQQQAAMADDSHTLPHNKDTSRTAALRK